MELIASRPQRFRVYANLPRKSVNQKPLRPLDPAERFQRLRNLTCPLSNFVVAQSVLR